MGASLPRATRTCCARGREVVREVDLGRLVEGRSRRRGSQAGDEGRVVEFGLPHRLGGLGRNSVARQQPKPRVRRQGLPRGEAEARARRRVGPGVRVRAASRADIARERVGAAAPRATPRAPNDHRRCDETDTVQREQALESMFAPRSSQTPTRVARKGAAP